MALPSHLSGRANVGWLKSLTALTPDELRQRGNHSQYSDAAQKKLDVPTSDLFGTEIWSILSAPHEAAVVDHKR